MKKIVLSLIIGFTVGVVAGAGLMLISFPYLFPPPIVNESLEQLEGKATETTLYSGVFREDASGQDFAHWAKGGIRLVQTTNDDVVILFESDFEASPGPNYWIYLNSRGGIDEEADFIADEQRVRFAKLKSFRGSQIYQTSMGELGDKRALTIWCETFSQYIGSTDFEQVTIETTEP